MRRGLWCLLIALLAAPLWCAVDDFEALKAEMALEEASRKAVVEECQKIVARHRECMEMAQAEDRLRSALRLDRTCRRLQETVASAPERQARLAARIRRFFGAEDAEGDIPQAAEQRGQWLQALEELGQFYQDAGRFLDDRRIMLQRLFEQSPPPPQFTTRCGLVMVLVNPDGRPENMFYVTNGLVSRRVFQSVLAKQDNDSDESPQGDVCFWDALDFCRELNRREGLHFTFRLLRMPEARTMSALGLKLDGASWVDAEWGEKLVEETDMQKRFGMSMKTIWDPTGCLVNGLDGGFARELPASHYSELGLLVTVGVSAGRQARLDRLRKEVSEEPETAEEGTK